MKKIILAATMALFMLAGTTAFAQNPARNSKQGEAPTPEQMAQRQTDRMVQKLTLNDEQSKQLYKLNLENAKEIQTQRERMTKKREARAAEMKKILTTEQYAQWEQMRGPRQGMNRGQMQPGMRNGGQEGKMGCCMQCDSCQASPKGAMDGQGQHHKAHHRNTRSANK